MTNEKVLDILSEIKSQVYDKPISIHYTEKEVFETLDIASKSIEEDNETIKDLMVHNHDIEEDNMKLHEAWDNVLADLDRAHESEDFVEKWGFDGGISAAREIIEKHMGAL